MCDYSLHAVASRPAKLGDELITAKFAGSITRGLSAVGEPNVAVCLLPGTEIAFEKEVEYRNALAQLFSGFENEVEYRHSFAQLFSGLRLVPGKLARFRRINLDRPQAHHDALEFTDGKIVLLTQLRPGQRATVLQLPVRPHAEKESAGQMHPVLAS